MKKLVIILFLFSFSMVVISCGTSTGSRYEKTTDKKEEIKKESKKLPKEDFDITNYKTKIKVEGNKQVEPVKEVNAWYRFKAKPDSVIDSRVPISTSPGYRVQALSTDNLTVADSVRSKLYFQTNQKSVYVDFDPPFYRVKVGDFLNLNDAKNMSFKLNQLGYSGARVVNDTVNVFK